MFGVHRSHVAIHDGVHKAELHPLSTVTADQRAVDSYTNDILHPFLSDGKQTENAMVPD